VVIIVVCVDVVVFCVFGFGCFVVATTSGVDHVDVAAARALGVVVARSPIARRDPVVEAALAALLALARRLPEQVAVAASGRWDRGALPGLAPRGLAGARVGVVGLGVIGTRMAEVLHALGAEVVGVDPHAASPWARGPLDAVLPTLDAITLHCALSPTSRGLLDSTRLDRLPAHAVVVNTARGDVLDVEAAVARVRDGRLRGLACDVFPVEPYPRLAAGAVPGVWFTPHAAGFVHDLGRRVADELRAALGAWARGEAPPHVVVG
jgi:phosphoglycerate dehydrogenase-like enzyme